MRLLSARVQNYRIHRDLSVNFHTGVNIIVGLNETGKSTLMEAMHRCLFVRHRIGGRRREEMRSIFGGDPTVTVRFSAEGSTWQLTKVFSGASGRATLLNETSTQKLEGDDAEARLEQFWRKPMISGQASKELDPHHAEHYWGHLWVAQGVAANDPLHSNDARELETSLNQQASVELQLLITPEDQALLSKLEDAVNAQWKSNHKDLREQSEAIKLASKVSAAEEELALCLSQQSVRQEDSERLAQHRLQYETDNNSLNRKQEAIRALEAELAPYAQLDGELASLRKEADEHERSVAQWKREAERLGEMEARLQVIQEDLLRHEGRNGQLKIVLNMRETAEHEVRARAEQSRKRLAEVESRLTLAKAHEELRECQIELERVTTECSNYTRKKAELESEQEKLLQLPSVTVKQVNELRQLVADVNELEARLNATSARVEVLAEGRDLWLDEECLPAGSSRRLLYPSVLRDSLGNLVRILPGETDLQEQTAAKDRAVEKLRKRLHELGMHSFDQAVECEHAYSSKAADVALHTRALAGTLDPTPDLHKWQAKLTSRKNFITSMDKTESLREDETVVGLMDLKKQVDSETTQATSELELAQEASQHAREDCAKAAETYAKLQKESGPLQGSRDELTSKLGDATARKAARLQKIATSEDLVVQIKRLEVQQTSVAQQRRDLGLLQPQAENLRTSVAHLSGMIANMETRLGDAVEIDWEAKREACSAELNRYREQAQAADRRARADLLLLTLAQTAKSEEHDRRFAPLRAACSDYLSLAYGQKVTLELSTGETTWSVKTVDRTAAGLGAIEFARTSHGAREFNGLAIRLAMAEVLARSEDDQALPIYLDDAGANVDPERFRRVGFLLRLAAERGLQVLFATCNTTEASELAGDNLIRLDRPKLPTSMRLSFTNDEPEDLEVRPTLATGGLEGASDLEAIVHALRGTGGFSSTSALRKVLDWSFERFDAAKAAAIAAGRMEQPEGTRSLRLL